MQHRTQTAMLVQLLPSVASSACMMPLAASSSTYTCLLSLLCSLACCAACRCLPSSVFLLFHRVFFLFPTLWHSCLLSTSCHPRAVIPSTRHSFSVSFCSPLLSQSVASRSSRNDASTALPACGGVRASRCHRCSCTASRLPLFSMATNL